MRTKLFSYIFLSQRTYGRSLALTDYATRNESLSISHLQLMATTL